jgi:hypothetical protein
MCILYVYTYSMHTVCVCVPVCVYRKCICVGVYVTACVYVLVYTTACIYVHLCTPTLVYTTACVLCSCSNRTRTARVVVHSRCDCMFVHTTWDSWSAIAHEWYVIAHVTHVQSLSFERYTHIVKGVCVRVCVCVMQTNATHWTMSPGQWLKGGGGGLLSRTHLLSGDCFT